MTEHSSFSSETTPEVSVDTTIQFLTIDEAHEHGFTEHVAASNKLDGKFGDNPTELQRLQLRHGDLALVRRGDTTFLDVFARAHEADVPKRSLARRMARAVFNR